MPRMALKNAGLSDQEIKVYMTVLSLWKVWASTVALKCWIKRTSCYLVIDRLIEKWLLSSFSKDRTTYFNALNPEFLLERWKNQLAIAKSNLIKLEKALPILSSLSDKIDDKSKLHYINWLDGLKSMQYDLLNVKWPVKALIQVEDFPEEIVEFLEKEFFNNRSSKISMASKTIIMEGKKHLQYIDSILKKYDKWQFKTLSWAKLELKVSFQIYWSKVAIYSTSKEDLSWIIIENQKVHDSFDSLFDLIWDII